MREAAIIRLLLDTGIRRAELLGLTVDDVDLEADVVVVLGKGHRHRACPFGKTALALDRYLRARLRHPHADLPKLWLAQKGALTNAGVAKMLERRARLAGLEDLHRTGSATPSPTSGCPTGGTRATSCG